MNADILFAAFTGRLQQRFNFYNKGASMNFMALITARFADLPFFTPTAKKSKQAPKPTTVRTKRSSPADKEAQTPMGAYRCTSIVFEESACAAVKAIGNKRFLAVDRNTPMLPLPECDQSKCNCKYMRHDDRRDDNDDRRWAAALQTAMYEEGGKQDRRLKRRGRRKTDR
jgi:hypothetical protein